jgi:hypothetical protein
LSIYDLAKPEVAITQYFANAPSPRNDPEFHERPGTFSLEDRHLAPSEVKMKMSHHRPACDIAAMDMRMAWAAHPIDKPPRLRL